MKNINTTQNVLQTKLTLVEEQYKFMAMSVQQSSEGMAYADLDGNLIFVNKAWCKMHGYKSDKELLGRNLEIFHNKKQILNEVIPFNAIVINSGTNSGEVGHITKNGKVFPTLMTTNILKDASGNPFALAGIAKDITERKQAENLENLLFKITAEASISEDLDELYKWIHWHLRDVLDTTNLFFGIINEDETIMSFPYYVDENDIPPDPVMLPQKLISEYAIKSRKPLFLKEQNIIELANKELIDLDVVGTIPKIWMGAPLLNKERVLGIIVLQSYHDSNLYSKSDLDILNFISKQITVTISRMQIKAAINESERKFRILSNQLKDSNSLKELLFDIIAHDLKNPASVLKGFADIAMENDPDNNICKEIQLGTERLLKVIDNTTVLSKVATGDEIYKEAIDITEMINTISKEFAAQLQFANMNLDMKIKEQIIVNANPIIAEVFRNYIGNAIKYASSGEKIIIEAAEKENILTINFIDQGDTISDKDKKYIFKRKVQLGNTSGSGLGLAIVNRIAVAHKAKVGVRPNKSTGNIFYIKIPVS